LALYSEWQTRQWLCIRGVQWTWERVCWPEKEEEEGENNEQRAVHIIAFIDHEKEEPKTTEGTRKRF
jgi:hypothetical protein